MTRHFSRNQATPKSAVLECLPGFLRDVAEATSLPAALILARRLGGHTVYVPRRPRPDTVLAQAIGTRMAARLSLIAGGEKVDIPRLKPSHRLAIAAARGSHAEVALRLGVTSRWVRKVRADLAAPSERSKSRAGRRRGLPRRWAVR